MNLKEIYNLIKVITHPYPGAWTFIEEKKVRVWKARIFDTKFKYSKAVLGEVVERFDDKLVINCINDLLLIDELEYGQ